MLMYVTVDLNPIYDVALCLLEERDYQHQTATSHKDFRYTGQFGYNYLYFQRQTLSQL